MNDCDESIIDWYVLVDACYVTGSQYDQYIVVTTHKCKCCVDIENVVLKLQCSIFLLLTICTLPKNYMIVHL